METTELSTTQKGKPFKMEWGSKQQDCLGTEINQINNVTEEDIERLRLEDSDKPKREFENHWLKGKN